MSVHAITPQLAHVACEQNLLVRNVAATGEAHTYRSVFSIDGTHPYLYENPAIANHVSGTTFVDMGRQLLKAITHLFYGSPLDSRFVLHDIHLEFLRWAQLAMDIQVTVSVQVDEARRHDAPRNYRASFVWTQGGHAVARATSSFTTFSAAVEARLMARQYSQPPVDLLATA